MDSIWTIVYTVSLQNFFTYLYYSNDIHQLLITYQLFLNYNNNLLLLLKQQLIYSKESILKEE